MTRPVIACADAAEWLELLPRRSVLAFVVDPPFAVREFTDRHKAIAERGTWRQPQFGRSTRPRFADLKPADLDQAYAFHMRWLRQVEQALMPGGHLLCAWHDALLPLGMRMMANTSLEWRAMIVVTRRGLRGGYRPKGAEARYPEVRTGIRAVHEPWLLLRRPLPTGWTVAKTLDMYGSGALREDAPGSPPPSEIEGSNASQQERELADHPCLKSQLQMRRMVRWMVPLPARRRGPIVDPFAGSGSTVAAAHALGFESFGCDNDAAWANDAAGLRVASLAALTGSSHEP